jgi:ribonuclease D
VRRGRTELARQRGVDADVVLPNSALLAIAMHNPATLDALAALPELTAWKAANYGPQLLAVLADAAPQPTS